MAQTDFEPTWAMITRPGGYPIGPAAGKLAMIWQTNASALYHRLSPYSTDQGSINSSTAEPFYYIYPDETNTTPNAWLATDSWLAPKGSATIDVIRVQKFLSSGRGQTFLARQQLLQEQSPYNERQTYNQQSPIDAAGLTRNVGTDNPQRANSSAGLAGISSILTGNTGGTGDGSNTPAIPGTTFASNQMALPTATVSFGAVGLLRATDANRGLLMLQKAWPSQAGGQSSSGPFMSTATSTQTGVQYRSDEGAYGMMIGAGADKFSYTGDNGSFGFGQLWIAGTPGSNGIRKNSEYPVNPIRIFSKVLNGGTVVTSVGVNQSDLSDGTIAGIGKVGYTPATLNNGPVSYGDVVGVNTVDGKDFEASDVAFQFQYYADTSQPFPTKDPEAKKKDDTGNLSTALTNILKNIKAASGKVYTSVNPDGTILRSSSTKYNYDRLFQTKDKNQVPTNYTLGSLAAYRKSGITLVSDDLGGNHSLGLPTAGYPDTINTYGVLDTQDGKWSPFKDDLVALYFYDVVNDKYIPFRAAIKGIAEGINASWEEMPFIGRSDKVYSYGGFSRNLNFSIHIVISSLKELGPTWQRINYLMTMCKPANYTKAASPTGGDLNYDRFVVPPMFMLTMGDVYRDQPILFQSVTMTIPDDAAWETLNSDNSGTTWDYMAKTIQSAGATFGQVPREVELGITVYLLEKERAVVGGANFGHAPRTEDFSGWNYDTATTDIITGWSSNLVVSIPNLKSPANPTGATMANNFQVPSIPIPGATPLY
jgi:hypothetical protein